jgi:methyl-accepting chemotaxis protein
VRALSDQAIGSEQMSKETGRMTRLIASLAKAMDEQSSAAEQISKATDDIRRQTEQTSKGITEQSKAALEISSATQNITRQIAFVTRANLDQASAAASVLDLISQVQGISEQGSNGMRETSAITADLAQKVRALSTSVPAR